MKSRYLVLTAATALTICGAPTVNAKTKTVNLKVTTLKSGAKTISGKATPGAKIRVTRYAKTYATGKATKQGTFKLKTKVKLKGGWHYKVTATKKGYQSKVLKRYVVKPKTTAKTNQQITALQSQINALQQQLAQLGNANNTDVSVQSSDLKNQIASLKNELAVVQAKVAQSKAGNKTEEKNENTPVVPFDEKPTEYYLESGERLYMFPDMEKKGQAEIISDEVDSESSSILKSIMVFAHLPKPVNNQDLPSWYDINLPSSKYHSLLVEVNGKKGYVDTSNISGLAVVDSYYQLSNFPDYLGTGTMKPTEVKFTHPIADGASWTQITKEARFGNNLRWYYNATTKTWYNHDSNSKVDSVDPFSGTPTDYFVDNPFGLYLYPDKQAKEYATKLDNGWYSNDNKHPIKSIKVYDQSWQNDNANSSSWYDANIPSLKYGTLPVEINGQKGFVKITTVTTMPVNKGFEHLNNLPDDAGSGTAEPQTVNFKFPLADGTTWTQYSVKAKSGITIEWRYNAATKTWQNMDLSK